MLVSAAMLAAAGASKEPTFGVDKQGLARSIFSNRRLLGGQWGPASYQAWGMGPSWGGRYYDWGRYAMFRGPRIPDETRMETSNDRRFAMIASMN